MYIKLVKVKKTNLNKNLPGKLTAGKRIPQKQKQACEFLRKLYKY